MKVIVITSEPVDKGQDPIEKLIGKEYDVTDFDKEDNSVSVYDEHIFKGYIVLNENEYEIMEG